MPDVVVHRGGGGVEPPDRFDAAQPRPPDEVEAGPEGRCTDDHRQAERPGRGDVALVDPAEYRPADRVAGEGSDPDVLRERDVGLEHDTGFDPSVGQDQGTVTNRLFETGHDASLLSTDSFRASHG